MNPVIQEIIEETEKITGWSKVPFSNAIASHDNHDIIVIYEDCIRIIITTPALELIFKYNNPSFPDNYYKELRKKSWKTSTKK